MSVATLNVEPGVDARVDPSRKLGLFQRVADFMFGYDFFISYCWADGRHYADELQRKLKGQGFNCFLNSSDYAKGDNWRAAGRRALKKTSRLILVGTPKAVLSEPVANELRIFSELGRRIFPIDFGGALSGIGTDEGIFRYLDPEMLRVSETKTAQADGPSEDVLKQIRDSFNLLRQDQKRVRWFGALTAVFATVAAVAVVFFFVARDQTAKAVQQQTRAVSQLARQATERGDATAGMLAALAIMPDPAQAGAHSADAAMALLDAWSRHREVATMFGRTGEVYNASFSPDGKRVVTASDAQTVGVWDAPSAGRISEVKLTKPFKSASFSPDGTLVATASSYDETSNDNTARVWNTQSGALITELKGHTKNVNSASFSPDGKRVVTASGDDTARVWDAQNGALIAVLKGHEGSVIHASFSPDGKQVVTASDDRTVRVWNAQNGVEITKLSAFTVGMTSASFSPDGKWVLTASSYDDPRNDNAARVWDIQNGAIIAVLSGHTKGILSASFSPDGNRVVTASKDATVRVWNNLSDAVPVAAPVATVLSGHQNWVWNASFSADSKHVVTASRDTTTRVWDLSDPDSVATVLSGDTQAVADASFSPDGQRVVTASSDKTTRVWDAQNGHEIAVLSGHTYTAPTSWYGPPCGAGCPSFSPDSKRVVAPSDNDSARVWNAQNGTEIAELSGHTGPVVSASFSPDGKRVVTASDDKTARVWDAQSGDLIAILSGHTKKVNSASFSADGKRVVTASDDRTVRVWDARNGTEIRKLAEFPIWTIASFSPDGKWIVTASSYTASSYDDPSHDHMARVWDVQTGVQVAQLTGHTSAILSASFSPNGKRVLTASLDNTARVWDAQRGTQIAVLSGHLGRVYSARFNLDGTRVVTASYDHTARIWDLSGAAPVSTVLPGHTDAVASAAFSPDGERVVTASADGTAIIHRVPADIELIALAKKSISRCLTMNQREAFGLPPLSTGVAVGVERNRIDPPSVCQVPDERRDFMSVIATGFNTVWTRTAGALWRRPD